MAHIRAMGVTVRDRVLLHLLEYWGLPDRGEWPAELTQTGIAGAVGITRSHVSVVLPELMHTGLVESHLGRVRGRSRRVKVYLLTYPGSSVAGALVSRLLHATVTAVDDSGAWDLPLDGLVQVHQVDMVTALASMDADGRIDLRALRRAQAAEATEEDEVVDAERPAADGAPTPAIAQVDETSGPAPATAPGVMAPATTPSPPSPPPLATPPPSTPPPDAPSPAQEPPTAQAPPPHPLLTPNVWGPPPASFWNPIRRGSGRLPDPRVLGAQLGFGFVLLMAAAFFIGISLGTEEPFACVSLGLPALAGGGVLTFMGTRGLWSLGGRRRVWSSTALGALGFLFVTVASMFLWDVYSLWDMLWVAGVLGVPSLLLVLGTGRAVLRRATILLLLGPLVAVAFMGAELLDPSWAETPARALLGVEVGASWAFVGLLMVRAEGAPDRASYALAGAAAGLAVVTVAWGIEDAEEDRVTAARAVMLAMWAGTAAWAVTARLVPAVGARAPPMSTAYPVAAASAGGGLFAACALFLLGGLLTLGLTMALIAAAMLAMVWPELRAVPRAARAAAVWGAVVAATSVYVLAYAL